MKKSIIFILALIMLSGIAISCKEFLEENPVSSANPEVVLNSPAGFDAALIGSYSRIMGWGSIYSWDVFKIFESFMDYQYAPYDAGISNGNIISTDWPVRQCWENLYVTIGYTNTILYNIEKIKGDPIQDRVEGEAKFLRAWSYFNLIQFFGDVPLVLEPTNTPGSFAPSRTPQADIYKQIISDLTDAETKMNDTAPLASRVNKWVAKAYLVKVYLTMAGNPNKIASYNGTFTYNLALAKAKEIINSNKYTINIPYKTVFDTQGDAETIWDFRSPDKANYNHFTFLSQGIFTPEQSFLNSFDASDARGPGQGMIATSYVLDGKTYTFPLPTYMKFVDKQNYSKGNQMQSTRSIKIIRFADVLLMAAEAENELNGPSQDAYMWINAVRSRAGIISLSGLTKDSFREAVFVERRKELYGEGFSWFDLKRFNKFDLLKNTGRTFVTPIDAHLNYLPIYKTELDNNPNVTQNPGWPG